MNPPLRKSLGLLALVAGFGVAGTATWATTADRVWGRSIRVGAAAASTAQPITDETGLRREIARAAKALQEREIRFVAGGKTVATANAASLGVSLDEAGTVQAATNAALMTRAEQILQLGTTPSIVDVPVRYEVDGAAVLPLVVRLQDTLNEPATSARLDLDAHAVIPDKEGRAVDGYALVAALHEALATNSQGPLEVPVPFATFAPQLTAKVVSALDITAVVSEYETTFSRRGDQSNRGMNIDRAASRLNGLILAPGQLVSFNDVVGDRSEANGFKRSFEIFKGEMIEGIGGGTCQVASTFYAASFFAGLDVVEHFPHSRPSAYMPMGLDATVVFPSVDLKLKNPHPFPVVVHAKTSENKLKVELLGRERPVTVAFARDVLATYPFRRKVTEDPALTGNKVIRKQHGIKGYSLELVRTLRYANGQEKTERTRGYYPPTVEIWIVPPGFDLGKLPALPSEESAPEASPAADGADVDKAPSADSQAGSAPSAATADEPLVILEGRGAHAPSALQRNPGRRFAITR